MGKTPIQYLRFHLGKVSVHYSPRWLTTRSIVEEHGRGEHRQAIIGELVGHLTHGDVQNVYRMVTCIRALAILRAKETKSLFQDLARGSSKVIRHAAETALSEMDPEWVMCAAVAQSHDRQARNRREAVDRLTRLGLLRNRAIRDRLVELTGDDSRDVRLTAVYALARVGDGRCLKVVKECRRFGGTGVVGYVRAKSAHPFLLSGVAGGIAFYLREGNRLDLLLRMTEHQDEQMRAAAADELYRFDTPAVRQRLWELTRDSSELVSCAAMCALVWMGISDKRLSQKVAEYAFHDDRRIRSRAVRALQGDEDGAGDRSSGRAT